MEKNDGIKAKPEWMGRKLEKMSEEKCCFRSKHWRKWGNKSRNSRLLKFG